MIQDTIRVSREVFNILVGMSDQIEANREAVTAVSNGQDTLEIIGSVCLVVIVICLVILFVKQSNFEEVEENGTSND